MLVRSVQQYSGTEPGPCLTVSTQPTLECRTGFGGDRTHSSVTTKTCSTSKIAENPKQQPRTLTLTLTQTIIEINQNLSFCHALLITTVGINLYHQYRSNAASTTNSLPCSCGQFNNILEQFKPGPSLTVSTQQSASNSSTYIDAQHSRCLLWRVL